MGLVRLKPATHEMHKTLIILLLSIVSCKAKHDPDSQASDINSSNSNQNTYIIQADAQDFISNGSQLPVFATPENDGNNEGAPSSLLYLRVTEEQMSDELKPHLVDGYVVLSVPNEDIRFKEEETSQGINLTAPRFSIPTAPKKINVGVVKLNNYSFSPKLDAFGKPIKLEDARKSVDPPLVYIRNGQEIFVHRQVPLDFKRDNSQFFIPPGGGKPKLIRSSDPDTQHMAVIDEITSNFKGFNNLTVKEKVNIQQNIALILHSRVHTFDSDIWAHVKTDPILAKRGVASSSVLQKTFRFELEGSQLTIKSDLLWLNKKINENGDGIPDSVILATKEGKFDVVSGKKLDEDEVIFSELKEPKEGGKIQIIPNGDDYTVSLNGELSFKFPDYLLKTTKLSRQDGYQVTRDEYFPFYSRFFGRQDADAIAFDTGPDRVFDGNKINRALPTSIGTVQLKKWGHILDLNSFDRAGIRMRLDGGEVRANASPLVKNNGKPYSSDEISAYYRSVRESLAERLRDLEAQ